MAVNLIERLLTEAVQTGGTYVEFVVSEDNIAFICNGGSRRSTRNRGRTRAEIKEDEKHLKAIDEKNLLFSSQLNKIGITLCDGRTAIFQKETKDAFCSIKARKVTETKEKSYEYVLFTSDKNACTGVAFATKRLKGEKHQIISCAGKIMNGPTPTGISTDLQFVLSGSFQVKEKTRDVWNEPKNKEVIEEISSIMGTSLKDMIHLGLLGMPLFSVLPNTMDSENALSSSLIRTIREICNTYPMFKNRNGRIVNRSRIAYGTDDVTKLFPQGIAEPFLGDRYWSKPCVAGSREEYFLIDVGVPYYDRERFLKQLFLEENLDECSKMLKAQKDRWLRDFYVFCSEPVVEESTRRQIISGLKNIRCIRDQKGEMRYPYEVACVTDIKPLSKRSLIIKPDIISPSGEDDEHSDRLREFFLKGLDIDAFSQKAEMEELVQSLMNKKQKVDKAYADKLVVLARFDEEFRGKIDFQSYSIFPYESSKGIHKVRACELVIGKPYLREGNLLASATGRNSLWKGFKKLLSQEDLAKMLAFAERSGAIGAPKIIRQPAEKHRDFSSRLFSSGKQGVRDSNYDFTIPGLEEILKKRSIQLNRLVWSALLNNEDTATVSAAEYSVDNRTVVNRCESSLILILKERTWVLGKNGKLYMPENIAIHDISEEFIFDKDNDILKSLGFGESIKKKKMAIKAMERLAAQEGLHIISEAEYLEFMEWKNQKSSEIG